MDDVAAEAKGPGLVRRLLRDKSDSLIVQLFRYTFVGGIAFLVDIGSLAALTELIGVHYLVSAALAFVAGLTTNYVLCLIWVFPRRNLKSRFAEFMIFAVIGVVGLGLNELIMWVLTDLAGLHYLGSKLASTVIVYLWNFAARKVVLFR
jgi:putative flippase GtrA